MIIGTIRYSLKRRSIGKIIDSQQEGISIPIRSHKALALNIQLFGKSMN